MLSKFTSNEVIELGMTLFGASTTRLLLDRVGKRSVTIALILLQYIGGTLAGYLAYQYMEPSPNRLLYCCVITLLSRDILSFLVSKEIREKVKDTVVLFLNLK